MTNLQLVEIDPTPGGNGLPDIRTVKAVSSSHSALVEYCKETFGSLVGKPIGFSWEMYYEIEDTDVIIVSGNQSKFDK